LPFFINRQKRAEWSIFEKKYAIGGISVNLGKPCGLSGSPGMIAANPWD